MKNDRASAPKTKAQSFGHVWLEDGIIKKTFKQSYVLGPPQFSLRDWVATTASNLTNAVAAGGTIIEYTDEATGERYRWPVSIAREIGQEFFGNGGYDRQVALPLSMAEKLRPLPKKDAPSRKLPIFEAKIYAAISIAAPGTRPWKLAEWSDRGRSLRVAKELDLTKWAEDVLAEYEKSNPFGYRALARRYDIPGEKEGVSF